MGRAFLGWCVTAALLGAACGKSAHHGPRLPEPSGGAGMGGEPGDGGGSEAQPGGGGNASGGAGQQAAGEAGLAGAGGETTDDRFQVIEPVAPPPTSELKGTTLELEPTDFVAPNGSINFVAQEGDVIVGTWRFQVFRPRTAQSFAWSTQAFRWTSQQGSSALVADDDVATSTPIGISEDGSVVFVQYVTFDESPHVCRWTAQTGCEKLPELSGASSISESCGRRPGYGSCVSRDGNYLVVESPTLQHTQRAARWSKEAGWETALDVLPQAIDDDGDVMLGGANTSSSLWKLGEAPTTLALPDGTDRCFAHFCEAGSPIVGNCRDFNSTTFKTERWPSPDTAVAWDGPETVADISPEGDVMVGYSSVPLGNGYQRVAQRWTEADGLVTVFAPDEPDVSVQTVRMSPNGAVVYGWALAGPHAPSIAEQWFRWSEDAGASLLVGPPGAENASPELSNADGSVLAGALVLWDALGPRSLGDALETIGVDRQGFEPEVIAFVGQGDPILVIGSGKAAPSKALGPLGYGIFIAQLPKR